MGEIYGYICQKCGLSVEYRTGGGFNTPDYLEETKKLQEELKEDIIAGKYGKMLKATIEESDGNLGFYCDTQVLECTNRECRYIDVMREKRISNFPYLSLKYKMEINIFIGCPKCKIGRMEKTKNILWCHNCQAYSMFGGYIGDWD